MRSRVCACEATLVLAEGSGVRLQASFSPPGCLHGSLPLELSLVLATAVPPCGWPLSPGLPPARLAPKVTPWASCGLASSSVKWVCAHQHPPAARGSWLPAHPPLGGASRSFQAPVWAGLGGGRLRWPRSGSADHSHPHLCSVAPAPALSLHLLCWPASPFPTKMARAPELPWVPQSVPVAVPGSGALVASLGSRRPDGARPGWGQGS